MNIAELLKRLGQPASRGTHVEFRPEGPVRYAFINWDCTRIYRDAGLPIQEGCNSWCQAVNVVPYERDDFPDDNWTYQPCELHKA